MTASECYLCLGKSLERLSERTRDKSPLGVLKCTGCGLIFLESFSHITDDFYENSGMHGGGGDPETEIRRMRRESQPDDDRRSEYCREKAAGKSVLDFGSGWGGFIRQIREKDITPSIYGVELESRFRDYMCRAENEDVRKSISDFQTKFDLITLFHCLEHIKDPANLLIQLAEYLNPNGEILIEVPSGEDALISQYQNQKFMDFTFWSCHLYLFTPRNLPVLAKKAGLKLNYSLQVQRYPLSNHLYWLAEGKPGGHKVWGFMDDSGLNRAYADSLARIGKCDTLLFSVSPINSKSY